MKFRILAGIMVLVLLCGTGFAAAESQVGTLEIMGVPAEMSAGRYDSQSGVFSADVRDIPEAVIQVKVDEVTMTGQKMEWRTKDSYLIMSAGAKLVKTDFELTGDVVEYFGDDKKLKSDGNVVVITEDATVYADHLVYDEKTDEALFTGKVKVVFEDGILEGEKFMMLLEKSELQFFGTFQGEFNTESN